MAKPIVHHIPVCPFSQRLEILLALKGRTGAVDFRVVDITKPRDPALLELSRGTTALPIMETEHGVLKESLVILRYLEERFPEPSIARDDPYDRAVEGMLIAMEGPFATAGYRCILNRSKDDAPAMRQAVLDEYARLQDFLVWQNPEGTFLFEKYGLAETVFTPLFMRFWFLDYYEDLELPETGFDRVRQWRDACMAHPAAQQVSREKIVKLYYDYTQGAGNGALPEGRQVSSFAFEPPWQDRPWPPRDKFAPAGDADLGLI